MTSTISYIIGFRPVFNGAPFGVCVCCVVLCLLVCVDYKKVTHTIR